MTIKTPGAAATLALSNYGPGLRINREDVWQLIHDAIEADRAQRAEPLVVIRDGCAYEGEGVEVIDLDFLSYGAVTRQSDYSQEDIDRMLTKLENAGLPSAADDVREWWAER